MKTSRIFISSLLTEVIGVVVILVAWGGMALFYPPYILPSPLETLSSGVGMVPVDLMRHLLITLARVMAGFSLAFLAGTSAGILAVVLGWQKPLNSIMVALQVIPGTILAVIFVLLFGIGNLTPTALVAFLTLPTIAINTANALSARRKDGEAYLKTLHATRWQLLRYSYLPAMIPVTQSNFSLGLSMAVKVVVLGEFIGSQNGLGYLFNHARLIFNMQEVFFYLMILMAFSLLLQFIQTLVFSMPLRKFAFPEAV